MNAINNKWIFLMNDYLFNFFHFHKEVACYCKKQGWGSEQSLDLNCYLRPPEKKSSHDVLSQALAYLSDVEVEVDVIRITNLAPEEPDRVGGDGVVHPEPFLPPWSVSH